MPARPIFIGGTSSNAGKSWMTTAIWFDTYAGKPEAWLPS